jgi:tRNA(Arg) A34 adenosine deaminase TadA
MPKKPKNNLDYYWNGPVSTLATLTDATPSEEEAERHRIYSLLLMAITYHYWCGNKYGRKGIYPWNDKVTEGSPEWLSGDYRGHNIAALAVNGTGRVVDFEFNHNTLFNSSAEHAEARLIRRVYELGQVSDTWGMHRAQPPLNDYNTFEDVTVYTSLESCAQCSGVMALARAWRVVYLQPDHGMYLIGNMLRNLTRDTDLESPVPISGDQIGLEYFGQLDDGFANFAKQLEREAFFNPADGGAAKKRHSVTSFLCTRMARKIYRDAAKRFLALEKDDIVYPKYVPLDRYNEKIDDALPNRKLVKEARDFYEHAIGSARRATPHK